MGNKSSSARVKIDRFTRSGCITEDDWVINEVPVSLVYNGEPHVVVMCTPQDLEDFVCGFSFTEGIIRRAEQMQSINFQEKENGIIANIEIEPLCAVRLSARKRQMSARTGCGICGIDSLEQVVRPLSPVEDAPDIPLDSIERALSLVKKHQALNKQTGAAHAVFYCDALGKIKATREDVGRHVAMDKLIGYMINNKLDSREMFCLTTSRASFEMVQKAISANFRVLVAISAPTLMAVNLAKEKNLKLIAFSKVGRINVYSS